MHELRALFFFNMLSLTAMMAFVPLIGPIIRELDMAEWHGGLMVTMAGVFWMTQARRWGRASDRHGRKPILMLAASGYVLAYAAMAGFLDYALAAPPAIWLTLLVMVILRSMVGGFYAAIPTVSAAQMADVSSPVQRASMMSRLGAANGMGLVLGPMLGGLLAGHSLSLPLYIAAALPALGLVWLGWALPRHAPRSVTPPPPVHVLDKRLRIPALAMLLAMGSVIVSQMVVGFYAIDRLGLDSHAAATLSSLAMTAVGVTLIVVQLSMSRIPRLDSARCLMWGALLAMLGFVLVTLWHSRAGMVISYSVMAAGLGMVFPSIQTLAANAVAETEQGTAAGTVAAVQGMAMVVMPLLSTVLYKIRPEAPYFCAALCLLLLGVLVARASRRGAGVAAPVEAAAARRVEGK
ncbi:MFS transporter [Alcanivorax quisquiliarum]|uniref:MFS transporter n=1 Tax=Alcanivorax quisquiliarum TaxID=2933565 RepID=A0ABT0E7J3_9GAMM|nr:MFS transporter [Alcanivorax quisquiliarum]MCK0537804.1 MFS transporter [Alcanivorax quisquiliarum]